MFVVFHPKPSTLLKYITSNTIYLVFEDVKRFNGETITTHSSLDIDGFRDAVAHIHPTIRL